MKTNHWLFLLSFIVGGVSAYAAYKSLPEYARLSPKSQRIYEKSDCAKNCVNYGTRWIHRKLQYDGEKLPATIQVEMLIRRQNIWRLYTNVGVYDIRYQYSGKICRPSQVTVVDE